VEPANGDMHDPLEFGRMADFDRATIRRETAARAPRIVFVRDGGCPVPWQFSIRFSCILVLAAKS
jgi:hypothetical protein